LGREDEGYDKGIGTAQEDEAARLFCERVKRNSGGRIEVTNYDAEVLLGIGETFTGVADGVADLAITSAVYCRGWVLKDEGGNAYGQGRWGETHGRSGKTD